MLTRDIMDRLASKVPELRGRIEGAAAFSALLKQGALPQQTPAAHVIPAGIRGGRVDSITGLTRQAVDETFAVVLTIRSHDKVGDGALDPLDKFIPAVIAALVGWTPNSEATASFSLASGRPVSFAAGALVYHLEFTLPSQLRIPTDDQP